jgi:RimJ/RimL family protein N-acetyltransferase
VGDVVVRRFEPSEWTAFREVRLRALLADPTVFSSSHASESARTDAQWQERLADPDCGVFGVFVDGALVGMTGIYVTREDPTVAGLWGSWLAPEHRRRGLSVPMYEARIAWARARPELRRILVSHRAGNEASRRANQKHGFVWTHSGDLTWRDGVTEPEVCYALELERST